VVERCPGDPRRHLRERRGATGLLHPVLRQRRTRRLAAGLADARLLAPDDERIRSTIFAIADDLTDGPFVFRYRPEKTDDGFDGEGEGSFTVCSFWLVSALVAIGELDSARTHCEKLIGAASTLGLYAEELDPTTERHLGNFPQALTHLALINAS